MFNIGDLVMMNSTFSAEDMLNDRLAKCDGTLDSMFMNWGGKHSLQQGVVGICIDVVSAPSEHDVFVVAFPHGAFLVAGINLVACGR